MHLKHLEQTCQHSLLRRAPTLNNVTPYISMLQSAVHQNPKILPDEVILRQLYVAQGGWGVCPFV